MITWPSTLPQYPSRSNSWEQSNGLLRPDTLLNPERTRTYPEHKATFVFPQLTKTQFHIFRNWWDETVNQCGAFTAPWLVVNEFVHHFCRFDAASPWSASMTGYRLDLTINLELIATVPMDGTDITYWTPEP